MTFSHRRWALLQALQEERMIWPSKDTTLAYLWVRELRAKTHLETLRGKFQHLQLTLISRLKNSLPTLRCSSKRTLSLRAKSSALRRRRSHKNSFPSWRTKKWKITNLNCFKLNQELNSLKRNWMNSLIEETTSTTNLDKKLENKMKLSHLLTRRSTTWPTRAIWFSDQSLTKIRETLRGLDTSDKLKELLEPNSSTLSLKMIKLPLILSTPREKLIKVWSI